MLFRSHICKKCGRSSTIYFVRAFKVTILIAVIFALILMFVAISSTFVDTLWGIVWVFIPFAILYLSMPTFYRLVPIKRKKQQNKPLPDEKIIYDPTPASGSTKIMPFVNEQSAENRFVNDGKTKVMPVVNENTNEDDFTDITNLNY